MCVGFCSRAPRKLIISTLFGLGVPMNLITFKYYVSGVMQEKHRGKLRVVLKDYNVTDAT